MPPKESRRGSYTSHNSPDCDGLGDAVNELCIYLSKGKAKKGEAKTLVVVERIRDILKGFRKKSQNVNGEVLMHLIDTIESNGGVELCSQLDPSIFCVVVDIILQADGMPEAQKGLYLLSASLHKSETDAETYETIKPRKESIGKACLLRLFSHFVDLDRYPDDMLRRWVGILIIELIRGSDENIEMASMCREDDRRRIAWVMLNSGDEHTQIVAGEIVRTLNEGGLDLETLWPEDQDGQYNQFPCISSSRSGWLKSFCAWLENVYKKYPEQFSEPLGVCYYLRSIELGQDIKFGPRNYMVAMYIEDDVVSILAPMNDGDMIHLLDTSLLCFQSIRADSDATSQQQEAQFTINLDPDAGTQTFLDTMPIELGSFTFVTDIGCIESLVDIIKIYSPNFTIIGPRSVQEFGILNDDREQSEHVCSSDVFVQHASDNLPVREAFAEANKTSKTEVSVPSQQSSEQPEKPSRVGDKEKQDKELPSKYSVARFATSDIMQQIKPRGTLPVQKHATKSTLGPITTAPIRQAARRQTVKSVNAVTPEEISKQDKKNGEADSQEQVVDPGELDSDELRDAIKEKTQYPRNKTKEKNKMRVKVVGKKPLSKAAPPVSKVISLLKGKASQGNRNRILPGEDEGIILTNSDTSVLQIATQQSQNNNLKQSGVSANVPTTTKEDGSAGFKNTPAVPPLVDDPYEIPDDSVEKKISNSKTPKTQIGLKSKPVTSTGRVKKEKTPQVPAKTKAKRQSTPADMSNTAAPVRESHRAAAAQAKKKILDHDGNAEEFERMIDRPPVLVTTQKVKAVEASKKDSQNASKKPVLSSVNLAPVLSNTRIDGKAQSSKAKPGIKIVASAIEEIEENQLIGGTKSTSDDLADANSGDIDANIEGYHHDAPGIDHQCDAASSHEFGVDVNMNSEPKRSPIKQAANQQTKRSINNAKMSSNDSFADRLGEILDGLPDVVHMIDIALPKKTTEPAVETRKEVALVANSLPTTSPFAQSSNMDEQTSPKLLVDQKIRDRENQRVAARAPQNATQFKGKDVELPAEPCVSPRTCAINAKRNIALKSASLEMAEAKVAEIAEAVVLEEFRKPVIPTRSEDQEQVTSKPPTQGNTTQTNSRILESRPITKSPPEANITEDAQNPSWNTSYVDGQLDSKDQAVDGGQKKRKVDVDISPNAKRQRAGVKRNQTGQPAAKSIASIVDTKSTRVTLDLSRQLRNVTDIIPKDSTATKDPARKPKLIAFSKVGPLNQGQSSSKKVVLEKDIPMTGTRKVTERKRKHILEGDADPARCSPPNKRQNSSPIWQKEIPSLVEDENMVRDSPPLRRHIQDSSPENEQVQADSPVREQSLPVLPNRHRPRSSRQSSQLSRVDRNGSPIATGKVDHISALEKRLRPDTQFLVSNHRPMDTKEEPACEVEPAVFAPKAQLSPRKKPRPSPQDEDVSSRYVPHEKTSFGQYIGIQSQTLIAPENAVDPFSENHDRLTPFNNRLRQFGSRKFEKVKPQDILQTILRQARHVSPSLPLQEKQDVRHPDITIEGGANMARNEDPEKTLMNSSRYYGPERSSPGMTHGTSPESSSTAHSMRHDNDDRVLTYKWNVAIRSHFNSVANAVHRIADEVIIRLSDEEDRMDLIVKQYDENGNRVLDGFAKKREPEKIAIMKGIEAKSKEMKNVYSKSKANIQERAYELRETPIHAFEKEWKRRQDDIQKTIASGADSIE